MNEIERERLLWRLAAAVDDDRGPVPPDERLRAYAAGNLSEEEAAEMEATLAHSAAARRRLAELAGIERLGLDATIRRRVVRRALRQRRHRRARWVGVAAALVAAAVLTPMLLRQPHSRPPIPIVGQVPSFEVRIEGLARVRSAPGAAEALPGTVVRIVIEPIDEARAGLAFGLYERTGGRLVRLDVRKGLTARIYRGSAVFAGPAERLVGREPGTHRLFVAVGPTGSLPEELKIPPGETRESFLTPEGIRVYARTLSILEEKR